MDEVILNKKVLEDMQQHIPAGEAYIRAASKQYLGDGVYFSFDGFHIWLTAENGICTTNQIALDPSVAEHFINRYMALKIAINRLMIRRGEENASGTGEVRQGGDGATGEAPSPGSDPDSEGGSEGSGV